MKRILCCFLFLALTACSLTQKDNQVIDIDPQELLLDSKDLPSACEYYQADASSKTHVTNSTIISEWPVNEGQAYIDETGRIDGWTTSYLCKNPGEALPSYVSDSAVLFSSIAGAHHLMDVTLDYRGDDGYEELIVVKKVGDRTRAWMAYSDDGEFVYYVVDFSYRNISHGVFISGFDENVKLDFALSVARTLLAQMEKYPLSDEVLFTP